MEPEKSKIKDTKNERGIEAKEYPFQRSKKTGRCNTNEKEKDCRELTCTTFSQNHSSQASGCRLKPKSSCWSKPTWPHQYPQYFYPPFHNSYFLSSLSLDGVIAPVETPAAENMRANW